MSVGRNARGAAAVAVVEVAGAAVGVCAPANAGSTAATSRLPRRSGRMADMAGGNEVEVPHAVRRGTAERSRRRGKMVATARNPARSGVYPTHARERQADRGAPWTECPLQAMFGPR